MAKTRVAQTAEVEYTLKCKGLSAKEMQEIYQLVREEIPDSRCAFRNPFIPDFDAKAVHEMIICLIAGGAYVGKLAIEKGADIVARIVERKLAENNGAHKKTVDPKKKERSK